MLKWQERLVAAFLKSSGGAESLSLELGDIIYHRGFMNEVDKLLEEVNLQLSGVYGKRYLVEQLLRKSTAEK